MNIFYGGAIQGNIDREKRVHIHKSLMSFIKEHGFEVISEHAAGRNFEETAALLEKAIGPLPPIGPERTIYVRNKMIAALEGDIAAAIFEVSVPSLGTGIEIAHAYLRPKTGLDQIPILALYEKDYWPGKLSSMIRGLDKKDYPQIEVVEYLTLEEAADQISNFLNKIINRT
jgi:hypothetical protein